jgi:hypothetical protein
VAHYSILTYVIDAPCQTLIFDCSYSPRSVSQEADEFSSTRVRSARLKSLGPLGSELEQKKIWTADEKPALGKSCFPEHPPYIFISACSPSEVARETHGRGNFSKAILNLLRHPSPHELLYSDLVTRIDQIPGYGLIMFYLCLCRNF